MNKSINILWIDDDPVPMDIVKMGLQNMGILANIYYFDRSCGAIDYIQNKNIDLILLDIDFENEPFASTDGFYVLQQLAKQQIRVDVILVSNFIPQRAESQNIKNDYNDRIEQFKTYYLHSFNKRELIRNGFNRLIEYIKSYLDKPPITIALFSDIHMAQTTNWAGDDFVKIMSEEFSEIKKTFRPNYACVMGDLVSFNQNIEFQQAFDFISLIKNKLGIDQASHFILCPGNHDVYKAEFAKDEKRTNNPWEYYYRFIQRLESIYPGISHRYCSYRTDFDTFDEFKEPKDVLSVVICPEDSVFFASMNSVDTSRNNYIGNISNDQWMLLRSRLAKENVTGFLGIGLLHHQLFPSLPSNYKDDDEPILANQSTAMREFRNNHMNLILHGHSHYPCIYTHNSETIGIKEISTYNSMVVSVGSLGGNTEHNITNQYSIVEIGSYNKKHGRIVTIRSRYFDKVDRKWKTTRSVSKGPVNFL